MPFWHFGDLQNGPGIKLRKSYEQFCDILPVFTLLGTEEMPPETIDIDDDPGLMLVCKYLKAYTKGKLNRISSGKILIVLMYIHVQNTAPCY